MAVRTDPRKHRSRRCCFKCNRLAAVPDVIIFTDRDTFPAKSNNIAGLYHSRRSVMV